MSWPNWLDLSGHLIDLLIALPVLWTWWMSMRQGARSKRVEVLARQTHNIVNAQRTAMENKIEALRLEVVRLTSPSQGTDD